VKKAKENIGYEEAIGGKLGGGRRRSYEKMKAKSQVICSIEISLKAGEW